VCVSLFGGCCADENRASLTCVCVCPLLVVAAQVTPSFTVLELGRIEWLRPAFHIEKHIFPLGYR